MTDKGYRLALAVIIGIESLSASVIALLVIGIILGIVKP